MYRNIYEMKINRSLIISLALMVLVSALYRIMPNRPWGFAPQWAVAIFIGALFVRKKQVAFVLPLLSMFISDALYQIMYLSGLFSMPGFYSGQWLNYLLFTSTTVFGFLIQGKKVSRIALAAISAPTSYFLASNFLVWAGGGGWHHAKTFSGLVNCYIDAIPFYQYSVLSTVIFSAVLFGTYYLAKNGSQTRTA